MAPLASRSSTDLPVEEAAGAIRAGIGTGALVLTAEPGAGKSSIVPLLALEAVEHGSILVLEPRRLAARATAERLAEQLGESVGGLVGLSMRGDRRVSDRTRIEVITEAVLTGRFQRDPSLEEVGCLIFDEFHERNLHSDLGLGMAVESRTSLRPDLAVVVMSATMATAPVADLLGAADHDLVSIVSVPGRSFPVETIFVGRATPEGRPSGHLADRSWVDAVARTTLAATAATDGSVLVFVPGRRETSVVASAIERLQRRTHPPSPTPARSAPPIYTLHGGTRRDDQRQVLTSPHRRIIVATSIAETSLTLPGVTAVVDGGLLRRPRFDATSGLGRLETGWVTRYSADQRRGRAGRLAPGVCYRLWSEDDHRHLDDATPPEIVSGDPLPVSFELARWGDPDADDLPLLDHPGVDRLRAGRHRLADMGLIDGRGRLTPAGDRAGRFGTHPRHGALLVAAERLVASDEPEAAALGDRVIAAVALLDDDRWPTTVDLEREIEERSSELESAVRRLRRRLRPPTAATPSTTARSTTAQTVTSLPATSSSTTAPPEDIAGMGSPSFAELLAATWPDRVAAARPGRNDRFLLAAGGEVVLASGPLSGSDFLVVVEADAAGTANGRDGRIRRAVPLERAAVLRAAAAHLRWIDVVEWDDRDGTIRAERRQTLGAIVLHRAPLDDPPQPAVTAALEEGLRRRGLGILSWTDRARRLRDRLSWLHDCDPAAWPDVSEQALAADLGGWLDLGRCRTPADLGTLDVAAGLSRLLDWSQSASLDRLAPTHGPLPDGRPSPIDYASGRPVWSVRLQRLLGMDRHPTIGPNDQPLTIELLSPAGRPVQTTTDLPGFWRGSYRQVRSELRGRYPKHPWPERPWETG